MNLTEQDNSIDSTNADDDEGSLPSSKVQSPNADKNEHSDRDEVEQTHDVDIDLTRVDTFEDVLHNDFYHYSDDQITNKNDFDTSGNRNEGEENDDEDEDGGGILKHIVHKSIVDNVDNELNLNDNVMSLKSETNYCHKANLYSIIMYKIGDQWVIEFGNYIDGLGFFYCASASIRGSDEDEDIMMYFLSFNFKTVNTISVKQYLSRNNLSPTQTIKTVC